MYPYWSQSTVGILLWECAPHAHRTPLISFSNRTRTTTPPKKIVLNVMLLRSGSCVFTRDRIRDLSITTKLNLSERQFRQQRGDFPHKLVLKLQNFSRTLSQLSYKDAVFWTRANNSVYIFVFVIGQGDSFCGTFHPWMRSFSPTGEKSFRWNHIEVQR